MTHTAPKIVTVGTLSVIGWIAGGALLAAGMAAVTGLGFWLAGCRHSGPLALLPPVVEADGTRVPARWCCHDCGATWAAALDEISAPVPRFAGFDEKKAAEAAQRASEFERRQRELAVRRAGFAPRPEPAGHHTPALKLQRPARPVAIRGRRVG